MGARQKDTSWNTLPPAAKFGTIKSTKASNNNNIT